MSGGYSIRRFRVQGLMKTKTAWPRKPSAMTEVCEYEALDHLSWLAKGASILNPDVYRGFLVDLVV